jgi:hypothetical protein
VHEPGGWRVLEQEATRAGAQRVEDVLVLVVAGDDQHARVGARRAQAAGRLDSVDRGHAHVHQHDLRTQPERERDGLRAVGRVGHDVDVVVGRQHRPQATAQQPLIVRDQDREAHRVRSGGSSA